MSETLPSIHELAIGAFLHDIGKLGQRASSEEALPEYVRNNEAEWLPEVGGGRYGYRHVLFTEAFFEACGHALPAGIDRNHARIAAVYHHKPDDARPWTWLVTVADRIASGAERKEKDAAHELETGGRGAFRTTPLLALQTRIDIGRAETTTGWYPPRPLTPEALMPGGQPSNEEMLEGYRRLWEDFHEGFRALSAARTVDHFHQGLIALSERLLWAVPSSTRDEPDIPLHDHALAVAAIACCLHRWHEAQGSLEDPARIQAMDVPKFRLLEGDLSGIQSALFLLEREQVKGINRILRGRSFLIGALTEAAALRVRRKLDLPPYVVLLRAGGRFTMLLPDRADIEETIDGLQQDIDRWLVKTWAGEIALQLALSEPLRGHDFMRAGGAWSKTWRRFRERVEAAKQHPLRHVMEEPVLNLALDYPEGADGSCRACGVMPRPENGEHCPACEAAHGLGRDLPRARAVFWKKAEKNLALFGEIAVAAKNVLPKALEEDEFAGFAIAGAAEDDRPRALPWRFYANHVPRWRAGEWDDLRYDPVIRTEEDIEELREGGIKTMAFLAHADRERVEGRWVGRPMLAVLKADVDHLGQVFARGFPAEDRTLGRTVALSRLMDAFFSGWLPWRLRTDARFRDIYTVYAGGDDLLLIGPWLTTIRFALELRETFARFAGGNGNLTLSAGIEFADPREPLNRSVQRAEERLERAKGAGDKDRVCLVVDEPITWEQLREALAAADWLLEEIREGRVSDRFVHGLLRFADMKAKSDRLGAAVTLADLDAAMWNARFQYALARQFPTDTRDAEKNRRNAEARARYLGLIGAPKHEPPVPARIPITIALYRNR